VELTLPVTLAVLGAALLHASWNALLKSSADKHLDTIAVAAGSGLVALVAAPWVEAPAPESWPWLAASALVHILYFICLAGAYRWGDLSYTYPIMRGGGPLIVALVGIAVLGEVLPGTQMLGVLLISVGILGFASGSHDRRATLFAISNAVVIGAYTLIDGQGARLSGAPVGYTLWFFAANGMVIAALGMLQLGRAVPLYLARNWLRAGIGGTLAVASYGVALWAMTRAPVALVAALRETSVIFAAVLGSVFLGEKMTRRKLVATGAVLLGLIFLKIQT
jgi:drug/metabolite transporter (DMT)-like permease